MPGGTTGIYYDQACGSQLDDGIWEDENGPLEYPHLVPSNYNKSASSYADCALYAAENLLDYFTINTTIASPEINCWAWDSTKTNVPGETHVPGMMFGWSLNIQPYCLQDTFTAGANGTTFETQCGVTYGAGDDGLDHDNSPHSRQAASYEDCAAIADDNGYDTFTFAEGGRGAWGNWWDPANLINCFVYSSAEGQNPPRMHPYVNSGRSSGFAKRKEDSTLEKF